MFTNVGYTPAQNPTYTVKTIGGKPTLVPAHFDNPTAAATSFVKERGCDPSKAKAAKQNEESWFTSLSKNVGKWWQENQQAITVGVTGIAIGGMAIATVLSAGAAAPLLAATIATTLGTTAATGATLATLALAGVATAGGVSIATGAMSIGSTIPSENNVLKPVVNSPTFQVVQGGSILVSTLGTAALAPYAQMGQQAKQEQAATNNAKPTAGQVSEGESDNLNLKINMGQQNKHIPGTNNYKQELANGKLKSILSADPQQLLDDFAGTGQKIGANKERIDFGNVIGKYVNPETGEAVDTTVGIIHYGKNGAHIVPARPK
ncbi:polymorphic toxin type 50 domain-containing protein [Pygmaiobacter massiliensis]|uniref:polymorphic toxin type 50 domain-containing protein n=1 Tax=Pygmaiobacter massiliensis TaxID=1917873 RepID=UPI00289F50B3|nr:polymorphic toxin type 50 domain-containing protein [Pygmaiobacter massiliensis]